jgi:hypothetical protein
MKYCRYLDRWFRVASPIDRTTTRKTKVLGMSHDVLALPSLAPDIAGGRSRSVPRLQAMRVPRVEHDLDVQRQIKRYVRGAGRAGAQPSIPNHIRELAEPVVAMASAVYSMPVKSFLRHRLAVLDLRGKPTRRHSTPALGLGQLAGRSDDQGKLPAGIRVPSSAR